MRALDRLRADKRVGTVDDERESGNGLLVSLRPGWTIDPLAACHTFGEETVRSARKVLARATSCRCDECRRAIAKREGVS